MTNPVVLQRYVQIERYSRRNYNLSFYGEQRVKGGGKHAGRWTPQEKRIPTDAERREFYQRNGRWPAFTPGQSHRKSCRSDNRSDREQYNARGRLFGRDLGSNICGLWFPCSVDKRSWRGLLRCPPPSEAEREFIRCTVKRCSKKAVAWVNWPLILEPGHNPLAPPGTMSPAILMLDERGEIIEDGPTREAFEHTWSQGLHTPDSLAALWAGPRGRSPKLIQDWRDTPISSSDLGAIPHGETLNYLDFTAEAIAALGFDPDGEAGHRPAAFQPRPMGSTFTREQLLEWKSRTRTTSWNAHFEEFDEPL